MASSGPAFLSLGTEVSAKYKGAFCEAKVKKIVKASKIKVQFQDGGSGIVTHEDITGPLKAGCSVEIKVETGENKPATITKITDQSTYTVVFDDGDENTLRRTQLCLKSEKHFLKYDTLDDLPLTHPEHFGTPVLKGKSKKRTATSPHSSDSDSDDESDEPAPRQYSGRLVDMIGKLLLMTQEDRKKTMSVPVLVVQPNADATELRTRDHLLVKSFKDSKFYALAKKESKEFTRDAALKNDDKTLKPVYEKALLYFDAKELPAHWDKEGLFGSDDEDDEDDVSSDDEQSEEKDMFVAQLYKFMDERGTPINKAPLVGSRDLNLYRLFRVVHKLGGYNRVTNQMKWRLVYSKMGLPPSAKAANQIKTCYKRYLHAFEDFYRKLGSTMGTNISRPSRSRHSSGRTIQGFRDRDRTESMSPKSPRGGAHFSKKEVKKEVSTDQSSEEKKDSISTKSLSVSPDFKSSRKSAETTDTENLTPSKRKTRGGVEEKATKPVVKEVKKTVKSTEEDASSEKDDVKKKRPGKRKSATKSEEDAEKTDDTETDSHKSETDSTSGDKSKTDASKVNVDPSYPAGCKVKVRYGKGKSHKVYEAKVVDCKGEIGTTQWLVHYAGWNTRYDEWVKKERLVEIVQRADSKKLTPTTSLPKPCPVIPQRSKVIPLLKKKSETKIIPKTPKDDKEKSHRGSKLKSKPPRPTRSTSVETSLAIGLSPRKRPRRNSGHTEISEPVSGTSSDSEESLSEKSSCADQTSPPASPRSSSNDPTIDKLVEFDAKNKDFDIIKELSIEMDFDRASQDSLEREMNLNDTDMPVLGKSESEEEMDIHSILSCLNKDDYKVQSSENESIQSDAEKRTWRGRAKARLDIKPKDTPAKSKPEATKAKPEVSQPDTKPTTARGKGDSLKPKPDTAKAKTETPKAKSESTKSSKTEPIKSKDDVQKSKADGTKPKRTSPKPKLTSPKPKSVSSESSSSPKAKLFSLKPSVGSPTTAVASHKTAIGSQRLVSSPKSKLLSPRATAKSTAESSKAAAAASPKAKIDPKLKIELERFKLETLKRKADDTDVTDTEQVTQAADEKVKPDTEIMDVPMEKPTETTKADSSNPSKDSEKDLKQGEQSEKSVSESSTDDQSSSDAQSKEINPQIKMKGKGRGKRRFKNEENVDSEDEPLRKMTRRRGKRESELERKTSEPSCDEGSAGEKNADDMDWLNAPELTATPKLEEEQLESEPDVSEAAPPLSPAVQSTATQEELSIDLRGAMQSPNNKPQHSNDKPRPSTVENTPPSTPPDFIEPEQPSSLRPEASSENASTKSEIEANLEVESYLKGALPPGGESPAVGENSDLSTGSDETNLQQRYMEDKHNALATLATQSLKQKRADETVAHPSAHRKRKRKVATKPRHDKAAICSDGDEDEHTSKSALSEPPSVPRGPSKYNFIEQLEEGKSLEGEARVEFLLTKIADLRSIYMQLKQEVASIDRRRKRQRKKQRLAVQGLIGLESALR